MHLQLFLYLIIQLQLSGNVKSDCGCNADRSNAASSSGKISNIESESICPDPSSKEHNVWMESYDHDVYEDMVLIPAGNYQLGTDDIMIESDKEGPKQIVEVQSYFMDKYEVSNRQFDHFVKSTNYKTEAEVFGDSFVFTLFLNSSFREELKDFRVMQAPWWYKVTGADWRHPHGPDSNLSDSMDHPAIHVSWADAQAYCKWRKARLPTEAEWEAACRGGKQDTKYPWGDKLFPDRTHMANIWQGTFPNHNSQKDGYIGTNPVHLFPQNEFGLHNIAGNVWEWTADSWSQDKPQEKVKKGGSYLCHRSYCYRYRCSARSHNTQDSAAGNLGFRCAKDA